MKYQRENNVLSRVMDSLFFDAMKESNGFIAGGAVRSVFASEPIKDFDIFFTKKEDFDTFISLFDIESTVFSMTDTAATHVAADGYCYQAICAVFGTPEEIIKNFDFTACMGAWVPDKEFVLDERMLQHCSQRRLVFNSNGQFPICSMWRAVKFIKRGWKLPAIESIKLALSINHLQIQDRKELKRQLMGIDTLFLKELTDSLGEKGEVKYDYLEAIEFIVSFFDKDDDI